MSRDGCVAVLLALVAIFLLASMVGSAAVLALWAVLSVFVLVA